MEIINFLGLPPGVQFAAGWIAAGFKKNHQHIAMGLQASPRRPNPYTFDDLSDIAVIHGASYETPRGDHFVSDCHYVLARPRFMLVLQVTPATFAEFRDGWLEDWTDRTPSLEQYRRCGVKRGLVDHEGKLAGQRVRWRS